MATDIASRGLDIADVSHVINYDVPQHPEDYIHRIGRTGRAEHSGDALTLMVAADAPHVYAIERFISQKIRRVKLENFDYQYTALFEEEKPGQKPSFPGKVRGAGAGADIFMDRPEGVEDGLAFLGWEAALRAACSFKVWKGRNNKNRNLGT